MLAKNISKIPWREPLKIRDLQWEEKYRSLVEECCGAQTDDIISAIKNGQIQLLAIPQYGIVATQINYHYDTPVEMVIVVGIGHGANYVLPHFINFTLKNNLRLSAYSVIEGVIKKLKNNGFVRDENEDNKYVYEV